MLDFKGGSHGLIRVGLIGSGSMGKGLLYQFLLTPGLKCCVLADIRIDVAVAAAQELKQEYLIVHSLFDLENAIHSGRLAICEDGILAAKCDLLDVIVDATNSILKSGLMGEAALTHGKHLIMMNSEADLIYGPYFMRLAHQNQLVYTSCDGDQHGVLARLIDEIVLWGFELVLAGNIKGFLDRSANPKSIIAEANKRNLDYKMATAYTDGSKLSIEMALLANAYGLKPLIAGMEGPRAKHVHEALHLFDLERIAALKEPVVDYILGAEPGGGVFVIGKTDNPYQQSMLSYYKMGKGPFYLFYRPYHLCHIESMKCIFEAVLLKQPLLQPRYGLRTNVFAYAKKDLSAGTYLDGIGGFCCYGMIEHGEQEGLPLCLADNIFLKRDLQAGEKIGWDDVVVDHNRDDFRLYAKAISFQEMLQ